MQRRAAAVSVAVFLLLAAGSYALIGAAEQPEVSLENPDYSVTQGEQLTIGGTTYNFTSVKAASATATWTNQSARYTKTWKNGTKVTFHGENYTVVVNEVKNPETFTLLEVQTVDKPTVNQSGRTYVIVMKDGQRTLVPRDEYLPEPTTLVYRDGDTFSYNNNSTTVAAVRSSGVTLEWFAPKTFELEFSEGANTTIAGTTYLAHFEKRGGNTVLLLTTDYEDYTSDVDAQKFFHERMNGLWGVTILSSLAAALLVMLAFLPSRY